MKKVLIIGAGGVGSWLAWFLDDYCKKNQFYDVEFTFADHDTVDLKVLGYQKFDKTDLTDNKAQALHARYNFAFIPKKIESKQQLKGYDCIVCAVDSSTFRRKFFTMMFEDFPKTYWIDLRSEGRTIAYFTKHLKNTLESLLKTLPKEDIESGSCQLEYERSAGIIQGGNRIIGCIGSQLLLNWCRNDDPAPGYFIQRF